MSSFVFKMIKILIFLVLINISQLNSAKFTHKKIKLWKNANADFNDIRFKILENDSKESLKFQFGMAELSAASPGLQGLNFWFKS